MIAFLRKITLLLVIAPVTANAELYFEISDQDSNKINIEFSGFESDDAKIDRDLKAIYKQIARNLSSTNLFKTKLSEIDADDNQYTEPDKTSNSLRNSSSILSPSIASRYEGSRRKSPSLQSIYSIESVPSFQELIKKKVSAILIVQANYDLENNLEIRLRLWDANDRKQLFGKYYSSSQDNFKKLSNLISNEIFRSLTGESNGHFNSKILYISESGPARKRIKKLALMNFDGSEKAYLTNGRNLVLTPVFSKKPYEIYYLSYKDVMPQIYKLNLIENNSIQVGGFRGTTYAAATHPKDDNKILLSAIFNGNSDIYEMNIKENVATRLTRSPAIDTTASYSPDGEKIIFVSDRSGKRKIYIMDKYGSNIKMLSKGVGNYSKPVFSPKGDMIAFTVLRNSRFYIATMDKYGENERLLTSSYLAEGARFSPNGRYLIYSKTRSPYGRLSIPKLFVIDIVSGFEYQLPSDPREGASDPDWAEI